MSGNSLTVRARLSPRRAVALALSLLAAALASAAPSRGQTPTSSSSSSSSSILPTAVPTAAAGESLYLAHCATCHMANGRGVPNFQPALVGSPIVDGPREALEATVWAGSSFLGSQRENLFGTNMPPFGYLAGEEVRAIVDYVRDAFGKDGEDEPAN